MFVEEDKALVTAIRPAHSELRVRVLERSGVINALEILTEVCLPDPIFNVTSSEGQTALHAFPREKRMS